MISCRSSILREMHRTRVPVRAGENLVWTEGITVIKKQFTSKEV